MPLLTFEGVDGGGKSTQCPMLLEYLQNNGHKTVLLREPGGTPIGEEIRTILLSVREQTLDLCSEAELLLFFAARAQLCQEMIKPLLTDGTIVLLDRFYDSSMAYQGYGRGLDLNVIKSLIPFTIKDVKPDLTIILDMDVEEALARRQSTGEVNRLDKEKLPFYKRLREGYLEIAQTEPERCVIVNASQPIDKVFEEILNVVKKRLNI